MFIFCTFTSRHTTPNAIITIITYALYPSFICDIPLAHMQKLSNTSFRNISLVTGL